MAAEFRRTWLRRLGNRLIAPLAQLGLAGKRTHILTVRGRKTGKEYSTPVQLVFLDGQRWLVAPYGERPWVRNARAAGQVELTRALRTERAPIEEVDAETAAPVLQEYLRKTPITRPFFDSRPGSPLRDFAAEARRHPVFRLPLLGDGDRRGDTDERLS
ncbi:nitroreductase family deazaflavin-dependent oxidoreductase [soil metagenome]